MVVVMEAVARCQQQGEGEGACLCGVCAHAKRRWVVGIVASAMPKIGSAGMCTWLQEPDGGGGCSGSGVWRRLCTADGLLPYPTLPLRAGAESVCVCVHHAVLMLIAYGKSRAVSTPFKLQCCTISLT